MVSVLAFMPHIFPYDPAIDTPLGHRNLILIYCVTWGLQLAYAAYALNKWRIARKETSSVRE
jgi:hypothetical protein